MRKYKTETCPTCRGGGGTEDAPCPTCCGLEVIWFKRVTAADDVWDAWIGGWMRLPGGRKPDRDERVVSHG